MTAAAAGSSSVRRFDKDGVPVVSPLRAAGPVVIDGRLTENVWGGAEALGQLTPCNSNEDQPETEHRAQAAAPAEA